MAEGAFEGNPLAPSGNSADPDGAADDGNGAGTGYSLPPRLGRHWVRWTKRLKLAFLDHLAATCDVRASSRAIGVDSASVYGLRRKDPEFAAGWAAALVLGYQMLETRLVGYVLSGGASEADTVDMPGGRRFDPEQALRTLAAHRQTVQGAEKRSRTGASPRRATGAETDALLKKQLDALARRLRDEKRA